MPRVRTNVHFLDDDQIPSFNALRLSTGVYSIEIGPDLSIFLPDIYGLEEFVTRLNQELQPFIRKETPNGQD